MQQTNLNFYDNSDLVTLLIEAKEALIFHQLVIEDLNHSEYKTRANAIQRYKKRVKEYKELLNKLDLVV